LGYAITQADAGSLTGTTIPSNITASSLTSVGVLTDLTVTNYINGSITGSARQVDNGFYTNSSFILGTTTIAVNRLSAAQNLTGIAIDGNSGSTTKLATARNINGVAFDGTAAITVATAAGTLTGDTLASNVLTSSLTSVGTLISVSSSGVISTTNITNTNSNNASSGSITTAGGVAITKDLYVGQNAYIIGNLVVTGNITDSTGNVVITQGNLTVGGKETVGGVNTKSFSIAMAAAMA
jgi:hypothetical protein